MYIPDIDIYDETEVNYILSLLKKSEHEKMVISQVEVKDIFTKSIATLKVEMFKLMLKKTFESITEKYTCQG